MQASNSPDDGSAEPVLWLELPDPCLLAVLRCCTDPRTLLSAARAHSRLRQAASLVLDSITADVKEQHQLESLQLYLSKHGQHVGSINLDPMREDDPYYYPTITMCELSASPLKLSSARFGNLRLQLQPGGGRGVLRGVVGAHLRRLEIYHCELLDGAQGLSAALEQLPGLEHLSVQVRYSRGEAFNLPEGVLLGLQQLTLLDLGIGLIPRSTSALQHLTALTRLADLQLAAGPVTVTPTMLASTQRLTRLQLLSISSDSILRFEPSTLASMPQLQHLEMSCRLFPDSSAGTAELLRQLQHLHQLTTLYLGWGLPAAEPTSPPAAAYAALTASSKLQELGISYCSLPAGVWQHVFPADRQLPHLQTLEACGVRDPTHTPALPDVGQLVSCCPGLQTLVLREMGRDIDLDLPALAQLTGLRALEVNWPSDKPLVKLSRLTQLTRLDFWCGPPPQSVADKARPEATSWQSMFQSQAPGDEPVWRQLLRLLLNSSDPDVAQQAAAGLAGQSEVLEPLAAVAPAKEQQPLGEGQQLLTACCNSVTGSTSQL